MISVVFIAFGALFVDYWHSSKLLRFIQFVNDSLSSRPVVDSPGVAPGP